MRNAMLAALLGAGTMIIVVALGWSGATQEAYGLASGQGLAADGSLVTLLAGSEEGGQQLILIDPRMRVLGVYQIDQGSGEVTLRCVRNFKWDLQMLEYNGTSPGPREIRAMMEDK